MMKTKKRRWQFILLRLVVIFLVGGILAIYALQYREVKVLIHKMKTDDEFSPHSEYINQIASYGWLATGPLLKEFKTSDHYVFCNITDALCQIPSSKRDKAFLLVLQNFEDREDEWLAHWYAADMIKALAENDNKSVIPVLRELIDREGTDDSIRTQAKIALNVLGEGDSAREISTFLSLAPDVVAKSEKLVEPMKVLAATLDQSFSDITTSTLHLTVLKEEPVTVNDWKHILTESQMKQIDENGKQLFFEGTFADHPGRWDLTIYFVEPKKVFIACSYFRASLWGGGYRGVVKEIDGQWRVVEWEMVWIS